MAEKNVKNKFDRQLPVIVSELCPHFMRVPRGYRRNGVSPTKGIIWQHICAAFFYGDIFSGM